MPGLLLVANTYNGIMTLAAGFFENTVLSDDVERLLNGIKHEMLEGCSGAKMQLGHNHKLQNGTDESLRQTAKASDHNPLPRGNPPGWRAGLGLRTIPLRDTDQ
jgi:hypothetical protein